MINYMDVVPSICAVSAPIIGHHPLNRIPIWRSGDLAISRDITATDERVGRDALREKAVVAGNNGQWSMVYADKIMSGRIVRATSGSVCVNGCSGPNADASCPGTRCGREWNGAFRFVVFADTQLGMFANNTSVDYEIELCKIAVQKVNALRPRPKFVVCCGDLTHAEPGHEKYQVISIFFSSFLFQFLSLFHCISHCHWSPVAIL